MQKVDLSDKSVIDKFNADVYWNAEAEQIKYQVADGCIIDQMLADWHAAILGLDGVFDTDKKRTALKNLYKNNFKKSMREVANMWRNFSVNDEGGTVICSYPEGVEQPAIPISYCEETMTGFEYALAGLMIAQGYQKEGERMVRAIRERYDGEKRNPWNEIECGSHYARSMASYALLPIYSGFTFDMTESYIGFAPIAKGDSRFLWSVGNTWGTVKFESKNRELLVLGNSLALRSFGLSKGENVTSVKVDGKPVSFKNVNGAVEFEQVEIHERLEIEVA
jgi:hypothetical protein